MTGADFGGWGEDISTVRSSGFNNHSVLSSIQIMLPVSIGVDVVMTGAAGMGFDFFKIGIAGIGVISSSGFRGGFVHRS